MAEIYLGKDRKIGVCGVDSHQDKNGKHPHDKNAGIVFYVGYFPFLHLSAKGSQCGESNKQQFLD